MKDQVRESVEQTARLEHFVETLQEQDDTMYLMRRIVKWMGLLVSVFVCSFTLGGGRGQRLLSEAVMVVNTFSMGLLSMAYTVDAPVAVERNAVYGLYEALKYFPVGRLEIYRFLRKRLLRFLRLYGALAFPLRIAMEALDGSLWIGSLVYPLVMWLLLAAVGFGGIRFGVIRILEKKAY